MFIKHPCPDFQGEIFHKSSIALSAYYMYANTIIVFNNYTVCLPVWRSLSKQSPLYQDTTFVKPDAWSAAVRTTLPCQQERFLLCKDNLAKSWKNVEQYTRLLVFHSFSTVHSATLAFSLAEIFSYMPSITVPLSIMVSITCFISLITSICEDEVQGLHGSA